MKNLVMSAVSAVALLAVGVAQAGPLVDVTFKNPGREQAVLKMVTANESSSYQVANPKPREKVEANTSIITSTAADYSWKVEFSMKSFGVMCRAVCERL
nr:hypothetical protein [uncultured Pseudomonas sp.]